MRNVLILGSGRSGTSLTAGLLAKAGYYMGERMVTARDANPKGFFECVEINRLNEDLLEPAIPARPRFFGRFMRQSLPRRAGAVDRWVAALPVSKPLPPATPEQNQRIAAFCARKPFCFKDPRFSYTLPAWRPYVGDVVHLVVFRHPLQIARSIMKELSQPQFHHLELTEAEALENVRCMYDHILRLHCSSGDWLFFHYDQILDGSAFESIEKATGAIVDRDFPDPSLKRSSGESEPVPEKLRPTFDELCAKAGYVPSRKA
ncbi:hypothetical protein GC173_10655 [bacterium]|nr:hypothetical protein [bacterium]